MADGETADDPRVDPDDAGLLRYDAACARALGDDLGVRWDAFPNADLPGTLDGEPVERLIAGAWLLQAGNFGTVGEWLDDPVVPDTFVEELERLAATLGHGRDAPASALLYDYAANVVAAVAPGESNHATMDVLTDTLEVGNLGSVDPLYMLGLLLHEAAHHSGRYHRACTSAAGTPLDAADDDWDGAYGVNGALLLVYAEHASTKGAIEGGIDQVHAVMDGLCAEASLPDALVERLAYLEAE